MREAYIIILNYKNWQDVVDCLQSVFRSSRHHFKVIVIDNNSGNDSLEHLMQWAGGGDAPRGAAGFIYFHRRDLDKADPDVFPQLVFIQNEENNGFAAGNNIALQLLAGKDAYIWLLNPDMVIRENTLSELADFADTLPIRSIIGAVIKYHDRPDKVYMYGGGRINFNSATVTLNEDIRDITRLDYISGGSLFTRAENFVDLGLLPEDYFLYWEETDWCYRARQRGYQLKICTTAICYDKISTTIGKGYLADYYYTRNGLLFLDKYRRETVRRALFFAYLRMAKRLLSCRWARARGVYGGIHAFKKIYSNENQ